MDVAKLANVRFGPIADLSAIAPSPLVGEGDDARNRLFKLGLGEGCRRFAFKRLRHHPSSSLAALDHPGSSPGQALLPPMREKGFS